MRLVQLGAAAALAGISQAFLLPPTTSSTDSDIVDILPFEAEALADGREVEVNCPGCPVQTTAEGVMHWGNAESILRLNFTVTHDGPDRLMLNGLQIYPVDPLAESFMSPLTADQLIKTPDNTWAYSSTPKLGYSLSVKHPMTESTQDQISLVAIRLEIIEVADKFIRGISIVELKLLETSSGKFMIGDLKLESAKSRVPSPADGNQECATLICKWKAIIADRLAALKKGCGSKNKSHGRPHLHGIKGGPRPHGYGRPRPHGPHHRHHRPHHSAFGRFLRGITLHIFVPILIGIAVGITASLVGMVVGHIVIFLWRLFFRRGQHGQYCRAKQEEASSDVDETKGFLENQGPPPVYEEAVIVVEEKTQ